MDSTDRLTEHHKHVFQCQELEVRKNHPEWSEDEILQRCTELRNYTIDREENRELPEHIAKIWNKKRRRN